MTPLLIPLLAFIAGILVSSALEPTSVWICLPLAVLLACAKRSFTLLVLLLLGAALQSREQPVPQLPSEKEANRVVGRLLQRPDWRGIGVYLDVAVEHIDGRPYAGRARLTEFLDDPELHELFRFHDLGTGDRIETVVRLRRPAHYRDPGVFDYRRYLERQGVFWTGTIRNPRLITVLEKGSYLQRAGDRLHAAIETKLDRLFASDTRIRGLVFGMVLGRKQSIPAAIENDFQAGGLYHLLVVSGFNLAVVAAAVGYLGRFVLARRGTRLAVSAAAALAYAWIVGEQPPVTRAALTVFIFLTAKLLDRDSSPLNALALAAMLLLIADPRALDDPSFQMTFAAAGAVVAIGAPAAHWVLRNLRDRLSDFSNVARDGFLSPAVADWRVSRRMFCESHGLPHAVLLLPWRVYLVVMEGVVIGLCVEMVFVVFMVESFHRLSPISPLLNVPAGIAAALITVLGLIAAVLPGFVSTVISWLAGKLIAGLLVLVNAAVALPYSSLRVPSPPFWFWCLYALWAAAVVWGIQRERRTTCVLGVCGVLVAVVVVVGVDFSPAPPEDVVVTFLDVGQGDSSLIEFPDGRRFLIDGGGVSAGRFLGLRDESGFSVGEDVVSAYLFSRGIRRLDVVVLTHAHFDHMDGLVPVLSNFEVGELWVGRNPDIPAYRALLQVATLRQVPVRQVSAGQRIGAFTVLHPPANWRVRTAADNNDSVVLLLRAGLQTALFTGDLERPLPDPGFVNVLKVAHHGSKGVRMRVASDVRVISVGADNPFGHPHPSSLPALRTDTLGAIEVRMKGQHPQIRIR